MQEPALHVFSWALFPSSLPLVFECVQTRTMGLVFLVQFTALLHLWFPDVSLHGAGFLSSSALTHRLSRKDDGVAKITREDIARGLPSHGWLAKRLVP